jgi:hypothetical protein
MTFNEFQRELQKRGIQPQEAYIFTLIYERLIEVSRAVEMNAQALVSVANNMQGLVGLNEHLRARIEQVSKGFREDGIDVASVANDPEERH